VPDILAIHFIILTALYIKKMFSGKIRNYLMVCQ